MSAQQNKGNRWGSFLSGAVAGLESQLDTILAGDEQASAKSRANEATAKQGAADKGPGMERVQKEQGLSRNPSNSRPNSRLQDRLARAVNKSNTESPRASSDLSRPDSPRVRGASVSAGAGRTSTDSRASESVVDAAPVPKAEDGKDDVPRGQSPAPAQADSKITAPATPVLVTEQPTSTAVPSMTMSIPSIVTPPVESPRPSIDSIPSRPSVDVSTPAEPETSLISADVETELAALQKTHDETLRDHREELHSHLERIDALQSKLTYLSQQLASSAKSTSDSDATPADKKLADKDKQIAALMEEGQKLSKTEMKHLTTIKKMRAKALESEKEITLLKQRLTKAEKSIGEQTDRAKRAEAAEKATQEKLKIVAKIEKDIEMIKAEREEAGLTIAELRKQLNAAIVRAEDAENRAQTGALEAEKRVTASLKEDLDNMRIEKKLSEDRAKRELRDLKESAADEQNKAKVLEIEMRNEITNLETKLELLRSRSEEVSSSVTGDSQATLLRQIETLQTQYALASENWQGIESTLTSRVAALEKDRDEIAKRESDIRRKARDVNSKARRLEDELDGVNDKARALEQDLSEQRTSSEKLLARLAQAEKLAEDARADLEREKKIWEADLQQRLLEEKAKWRTEMQPNQLSQDNLLRADSPSASNRRHSPDPSGFHARRPLPRSATGEMSLSAMDRMFVDDRRPSSSRTRSSANRTPEIGSPPMRQDSIPSSLSNLNGLTISTTPSIHTFDNDDGFENTSSPQRTINDMISVSTVGAGPSVQLVERMSAAVRRLESEKATTKEEMTRLASQRDEAREEVVSLMREIEEKRGQDEKLAKLETELQEMNERYETTLEMLGEKSEKVEELEGDVADLKKIYRDLVQTMK
ncbi:hypothetical protein BU24DRAFT_342230 [Aaosphaeria arxii CBS 175.79]|uniref:TATA element modulatory factor 1 TATA binding domain-containing protein n=1 Tax=Aaosphaeria arxii CBS 175.79 TaxID=1450172 RepID=A0A6A5Y0V0_9PLEO|nr:uncharacterized protein BU24DRAFT_342230 [Aaosphaeria arxii CBS 175.79]KAF2018856.1 hypothetical protein BU24DRAFT_342230 [Aaosphaeria arxii CBS 175.79]